MLSYSALFDPDKESGGFVVTFPDVPEAITQGADETEALSMAAEVLVLCLDEYIRQRMPIPIPRKERGKRYRLIHLPALVEAKVLLYAAMLRSGMRKADLARKLGCAKSEVDRLLNLEHASRLEQIERASAALGKRLVVALEDAA